jgi:hypothetical protein
MKRGIGCMELGFWKLKVTAGTGNIRNCMACLTNPISQPVWTFLPSGSPLSATRLPTYVYREDQYDVTDSSWVSMRF